MKKVLEIKKDGEKVLRVTMTGRKNIVLKAFETLSEDIFSFIEIGSAVREGMRTERMEEKK